MSNSPIFMVDCPRSGTGLLRDLLRSHPHITFAGESHFIPKLRLAGFIEHLHSAGLEAWIHAGNY